MRQLIVFSIAIVHCLAANDGAGGQERAKKSAEVRLDKDPFSMKFPTADAKAAALIEVFRDPEAGGQKLDLTVRAYDILVGMGTDAVPKLVEGIHDSNHYVSSQCIQALSDIGQPAVVAVRARWPKLNDAERWRLMEFLGKHDYDRGADYALDCLKSTDEEIRRKAWRYLLRHKEKRVKEEFFRNLEGKCEFPPCYAVIRDEPVFEAQREEELLIALLDKNSWAAQDRGFPKRQKLVQFMPNDERYFVLLALQARNAKKAAPALMPVLQAHGPGRGYMGALIIPMLADWGYKEAIPELQKILSIDAREMRPGPYGYTGTGVKKLAARALWQLGHEAGRQYLLALDDSKAFVAKSVARCGDKRDIPLLVSWLDDPNGDVVESACQGLARITGVNIHAGKKPEPKSSRADAILWKKWYANQQSRRD